MTAALATLTLDQLNTLTMDALLGMTMEEISGSGDIDSGDDGSGTEGTSSRLLAAIAALNTKVDAIYGLLGAWSMEGTTLSVRSGNVTRTYTLTKTGGQITAITETNPPTLPADPDDYGGI